MPTPNRKIKKVKAWAVVFKEDNVLNYVLPFKGEDYSYSVWPTRKAAVADNADPELKKVVPVTITFND